MRKIELLAPAKNLAGGRIAIDYGADALYIGGAKFGARYAATNSTKEIEQLVSYANQYGVKVYAALNTILYEEEINEAKQNAIELINAGVSALIVQDMAYMRMGLSGVEFHASTQTCNNSSEKVNFFANSGFSRVILERGLSGEEIKNICNNTNAEIECFIHGAICVGNSGECYMSRSCSQRSGNRGECSQPCRLPYDLVDKDGKTIISNKFLLSVNDMNLTPKLNDLLKNGVTSFKIEGRLKDTHYIKNAVGHYRQQLDSIFLKSGGKYKRSSLGETKLDFAPDVNRCFTRGGSTYFYENKQKNVCTYNTSKAVGEKLGNISATGKDWIEIQNLKPTLNPADGICIISENNTAGTNVNKVAKNRLYLNNPDIIENKGVVYRNYDHKFSQEVEGSRTKRVIKVTAKVTLKNCNSLSITITDEENITVTKTISADFEAAKNIEKANEMLVKQIAKSGDTIFEIVDVSIDCTGDFPFIPTSQINNIRRDVLEELLKLRQRLKPAINCATEELNYKYYTSNVNANANVINSLARAFYKEHGVDEISDGMDSNISFDGEVVMTTPYCIRRELGECIKNNSKIVGDLKLVHNNQKYLLRFNCVKCEMQLVKDTGI